MWTSNQSSSSNINESSSSETSSQSITRLQEELKRGMGSSRSTITDNGSGEDEPFEVLDLAGLTNRTSLDRSMDRLFGDITKASAGKQALIGGGAGWLSGMLLVKVGKVAALTIGATALAFQVAQHNGLIKVEWTKVNRMVQQAQKSAKTMMMSRNRRKIDLVHEVKNFYHENFFLAVGFSGGFLAGVFF